MTSFKRWNASQWIQLHRAFQEPANPDIVQAVIEGAAVCEPSDWQEVSKQISPWVHITSAFINVAQTDPAEVQVFLQQVRRYVPAREDARMSLAVLVHTLTLSLEQNSQSASNWNLLRQTIGLSMQCAPNPGYDKDFGDWALD